MKNGTRWLVVGLLGAGMGLAASSALAQSTDQKPAAPKSLEEVPASRKIMYRIDLTGEFGHDVNRTPMKQVLEEARRWSPDYLVFYVNMTFGAMGQSVQDWAGNPRMTSFAYQQLETARELQTMFTDGIRDDPNWKTRDGGKPQLIMWVKKAMGGPAFLPFVAPSIYYTSDGRHGGIGYLDHIFDGVGDIEVREKQYSLRLARAVGLAEKGGHDGRILRAMSRLDYVLSVSYEGGKPVFFNDFTGDEQLTDGGSVPDSPEERIRMEGNDVLNLNAQTALRLGLAKGICDNADDLAADLGIERDYVVVTGRANDIFGKWRKDVNAAERDFNRLWREFDRTPIEGATPDERNKGRAKRISILNKIDDLLKRYAESINPREIQGAPEEWESQIDRFIAVLKQQIRLDR